MSDYYFEYFCKLLSEDDPLSKSTAMSFYHKLKIECLPLVKTEISKTLINLDEHNKLGYINYLLEEINNQEYVKEADITYIQPHLDKYKVDLKTILDFDLNNLPHTFRFQVLDIHYKDMKPFSLEKDIAFQVQYDFINYFCKIVADELITFCEIKKASISQKNENKTNSINNEQLEEFVLNVNSTDGLTREMDYYTYVNYNLDKFIDLFEKEVNSNIIKIEDSKVSFYFSQVFDVLEQSIQKIDETKIDKYIQKYNLDISKFPNFDNQNIKKVLSNVGEIFGCLSQEEYELNRESELVQNVFYEYTVLINVKALIVRIKNLKQKYYGATKKVEIQTENTNYNKSVFQSYKSQKWFDTALRSLNTFDEVGKIRRGFQAIANTFYKDEICRKVVFQYAFQLKDFIAHINKEYNAGIKSDNKLSESLNHIDKVNDLAKEYQSKLQNNVAE